MSTLRLLQWLGPWTNQSKSPTNIQRQTIRVTSLDFDMWLYHPKTSTKGAMFLIPGIYHEGPADLRMDRFARVLANSGILVGVPFLPTMMNLTLTPSLLNESSAAFATFLEHSPFRPGIFSISAASIAALWLANQADFTKQVGKIMIFGGFLDWQRALTFAMTGRFENGKTIPVDPLNLPVVFLNLIDHIQVSSSQKPQLKQAWRQFIHKTWEKPEMQATEIYTKIASELAEQVPAEHKNVFLQGCSVLPGGIDIAQEALQNYPKSQWLDPKPLLQNLRVPLAISHGKEDVVVPWTEAQKIANLVPTATPSHVHVTGFYHHTGLNPLWKILRILPTLPLELYRSIGLVSAMYDTATVGGLKEI